MSDTLAFANNPIWRSPAAYPLVPNRTDRCDCALLFNIVASRHWLDDLDQGLTIKLGQLKRDDSIGSRWQSIAGCHRNQWQPQGIVGARP
jgi:hypothetical protein